MRPGGTGDCTVGAMAATVDDSAPTAVALAATIAAGERGVAGRPYNIGGGSRVSMNDVIAIIEKTAGRRLKIDKQAVQRGDMRDTYADTTLARRDLGFAPTVSLEEGIQAEYRWLSSSPALVA